MYHEPESMTKASPKQHFSWSFFFRLTYLSLTFAYLASLWLPYIQEPIVNMICCFAAMMPTIASLQSHWMHLAPALAPLTWFVAGTLACFACPKKYVPTTIDLVAARPSRSIRRQRPPKLRYKLKSTRDHKLHRRYPHRLKKENQFHTQAPTMGDRMMEDMRQFFIDKGVEHQASCHRNGQKY